MKKLIAILLILTSSACTSKKNGDFLPDILRLELTIETYLEQDESGNKDSTAFSPKLTFKDSMGTYYLLNAKNGDQVNAYLDSVQTGVSPASCVNKDFQSEPCGYYLNLPTNFAKEPHQLSIEILQNNKITAKATFNIPGNFTLLQPSDVTNPIQNSIPFIVEWNSKNHPKTVELIGSGQDCMASTTIDDIPTTTTFVELSTDLMANDLAPCARYQTLFLRLTEDTNIPADSNEGFEIATTYWKNYYSSSLRVRN